MKIYRARPNTHRPTQAKSTTEPIASALAPRRRIPYGLTALFILCLAHAPQATAQFTTVINLPPDMAPTEIGSDTQLNVLEGGMLPSNFDSPFQAGLPDGSSSNIEVNISGGSVGHHFDANSGSHVTVTGGSVGYSFNANFGSQATISGGSVNNNFRANSGSQVRISGGTVGGFFEAAADSQVTISGGSVGFGFNANFGSQVTISGGSVGGSFDANSGSQVTISGGTVSARFCADEGSQVTLSGGEFLLNGAAPLESIVTLSSSDVLTGTLEDGSPFIFSPLADLGVRSSFGDELNGVTLSSAPLPALDTTPLVVDSETAPRGLREGQTLTVAENGVLGDDFAAVNATLSIEGGEAGNDMEVAGTQVTIDRGTVGNRLRAYAGSQVTLSSGVVGTDFQANSGSQVTITGGTVGFDFKAWGGSQVIIAGGAVGDEFSAFSGSQVTISGGTLGFTFSAWDGSQVNISGGTVGARFRVDEGSQVTLSGGDFLLNGAAPPASTVTLSGSDMLTGTLEDGTPFIFAPQAGDELNGVTLSSAPLPAVDTTPIVVDSETAPRGLREGQTLTLVENGVLGDNFAAVNATLHIEGGQVGYGMEVAGSQVIITGGLVGAGFRALGGSQVTISSGSVRGFFYALSGSQVTISGGTLGDAFRASSGSEVNVFGAEFLLGGLPIEGLVNPGDSLVLEEREEQLLTGTLADGSPFRFELSESNRIGDYFDEDAVLRLTLVGQPTLPGDYNSDGVVDARDYTVWRDNLGAEAGTLPNDVDGGAIGAAQYATWLENFGASTPAGVVNSTAVPEPSALALLMLGAAGVWGGRRVRR